MISASAPVNSASRPSATAPLAPPPPVNGTPIAECDAGGDAFGCCTEEGFSHLREMARNRTPAECRAIEALESYGGCPTPVARGVHGVIADCMKGAMVRELDRRLLVLKGADQVEFRREMDLQAAYLRAVNATCNVNDEPSTSDFPVYFSCLADLYERRAKEASLINERRFKLGNSRHAVTKQKEFEAYAKGLCAMPSDIWESRQPPPACVESVLKVVP